VKLFAVVGAVAAVAAAPMTLPLGDGHVSTSAATRGSVYICPAGPGGGAGGGAQVDGPWIHGSTFEPGAKPTVSGHVLWANARISFTQVNGRLRVVGNGLPKRSPTGVFPIQDGTTAFQYDRNPNSIEAQSIDWLLPKPKAAAKPGCLTGGPIGIAVNGVPIFDALDALNRDAVAHEMQDACGGHPQAQGMYHYHSIDVTGSCLPRTGLVGYALDGYPIYGPYKANGKPWTDAELDACHGHVVKGSYRYQATLEYPYTLGCFHGTPLRLQQRP